MGGGRLYREKVMEVRSTNLVRFAFILLAFFLNAVSLYGQGDAIEDYKSFLKGKGQSLVDDVRKKNGILATTSFAQGFADKLIGGSFEDSPVDYLISRDFSVIDSALIDIRVESQKPVVVVIYRSSYAEANPQLLEYLVRNVSTTKTFIFKVSYEEFPQLASVYVLGGTAMQIFDVKKSEGQFGVFKREEVGIKRRPLKNVVTESAPSETQK